MRGGLTCSKLYLNASFPNSPTSLVHKCSALQKIYKNIIKPLDRARYPELRYIHVFNRVVNVAEKKSENLVYSDFLCNLAAQNVKWVRLWQK